MWYINNTYSVTTVLNIYLFKYKSKQLRVPIVTTKVQAGTYII